MQVARKCLSRALILNGVSGFFYQISATIWAFALIFAHGKPQFTGNSLCRIAQRFE